MLGDSSELQQGLNAGASSMSRRRHPKTAASPAACPVTLAIAISHGQQSRKVACANHRDPCLESQSCLGLIEPLQNILAAPVTIAKEKAVCVLGLRGCWQGIVSLGQGLCVNAHGLPGRLGMSSTPCRRKISAMQPISSANTSEQLAAAAWLFDNVWMSSGLGDLSEPQPPLVRQGLSC